MVGPGIDEHTPWHQYHWRSEGGYAFEVHRTEDVDWLIASQTIGRSEQGSEQPGRIYTQAHYLLLPTADFSPLLFRGIIQSLSPVPMQEKNNAMPECTIDVSEHPLPEDWCDRIASLIRCTMSGVELSWQDVGLKKQDWLDCFSSEISSQIV